MLTHVVDIIFNHSDECGADSSPTLSHRPSSSLWRKNESDRLGRLAEICGLGQIWGDLCADNQERLSLTKS